MGAACRKQFYRILQFSVNPHRDQAVERYMNEEACVVVALQFLALD